jgi:hypothetical protein
MRIHLDLVKRGDFLPREVEQIVADEIEELIGCV